MNELAYMEYMWHIGQWHLYGSNVGNESFSFLFISLYINSVNNLT